MWQAEGDPCPRTGIKNQSAPDVRHAQVSSVRWPGQEDEARNEEAGQREGMLFAESDLGGDDGLAEVTQVLRLHPRLKASKPKVSLSGRRCHDHNELSPRFSTGFVTSVQGGAVRLGVRSRR